MYDVYQRISVRKADKQCWRTNIAYGLDLQCCHSLHSLTHYRKRNQNFQCRWFWITAPRLNLPWSPLLQLLPLSLSIFFTFLGSFCFLLAFSHRNMEISCLARHCCLDWRCNLTGQRQTARKLRQTNMAAQSAAQNSIPVRAFCYIPALFEAWWRPSLKQGCLML